MVDKDIINIEKVDQQMTVIEFSLESPILFVRIIKSGLKQFYHVITEWKCEQISHRLMMPIEIMESYSISAEDIPDIKKTNKSV